MNQIVELLSINYVDFVLAMITIMIATPFVKEVVEKFCKTVGIEFSWIKAKNSRRECEEKIKKDLDILKVRQEELESLHKEDMNKHREYSQNVMTIVSSLKEDIISLKDDIEKREAEKRFRKLRYDILNFANQIISMQEISSELIDQIFDECQEYEDLVSQYNFSNDRVNVSMKVIKDKYQELLVNGKIYKED